MKNETSRQVRLGLFVTLGMAVFILGIYFIGEGQQLFQSTFRITGIFRDVAGLQAGNNVRLSGVNIGVVDLIRIVSDTSVQVEILVEAETRKFIMKDAVASIGSEGLMGNKVLIINPGTGDAGQIEDNDIIVSMQPTSMDDLIVSLRSTVENTSDITRDLSKITFNIQAGKGTIGKLLMDSTWRENIQATLANVQEGAIEFHRLMEKANELDDIVVSLRSTMENTASITSDLAKVTNDLSSGRGTVGALLYDETWKTDMDSTLVNLKRSSEGLRILLEVAKDSWLMW